MHHRTSRTTAVSPYTTFRVTALHWFPWPTGSPVMYSTPLLPRVDPGPPKQIENWVCRSMPQLSVPNASSTRHAGGAYPSAYGSASKYTWCDRYVGSVFSVHPFSACTSYPAPSR